MSGTSQLSLNAVTSAGRGAALTYANGVTWPTAYVVEIQTTGFPVFNLQVEGGLMGITWAPIFGPFGQAGDFTYNPIIGQLGQHNRVQATPAYPQICANLLWIFPSLINANAQFTGSINGATLTVSNVTGTIAAGQVLTATGTNFFNGAPVTSPIPPGVTILSGAGTTWTISQNLGTVAAEPMYTAQAPTISATIKGGP